MANIRLFRIEATHPARNDESTRLQSCLRCMGGVDLSRPCEILAKSLGPERQVRASRKLEIDRDAFCVGGEIVINGVDGPADVKVQTLRYRRSIALGHRPLN